MEIRENIYIKKPKIWVRPKSILMKIKASNQIFIVPSNFPMYGCFLVDDILYIKYPSDSNLNELSYNFCEAYMEDKL